jgi:hypothetical protein
VEPLIDELEPVVAPDVPLVAPVVPDEPLDAALPIFAFVSMKCSLPLALPDVPVVAPDVAVEPAPEVPVAPLDDERQPVTVIEPALLCRELLLV